MTVKEIVSAIRVAKTINIAWNGSIREIDPDDALDMDAHGDYVVDYVSAVACGVVEIGIAARPVKA